MTRDEIVSVGFDFCGDYKIIEHYASHLQDINFESFKPVMMAALRSLLPKDWSTAHETAWEWLWTTVARNLKEATMKVRAFRPSMRSSSLLCRRWVNQCWCFQCWMIWMLFFESDLVR
jgi:hypothetical protein